VYPSPELVARWNAANNTTRVEVTIRGFMDIDRDALGPDPDRIWSQLVGAPELWWPEFSSRLKEHDIDIEVVRP
jgi:hypothetical protein